MEFRILGPLEVLDDGRPLELGGAKHRALLAVLLLHANEVVSTDRLIDALWDGEAPESGRKALQVYVSGLRKALGKERLETQAPGYRLRVRAGELDLERFERLVESGDLQDALALWRGSPLSEFSYQRFAQADIGRLEELRLSCLEDRIEGDLAAGRHAVLVGELEPLVREHPLRERLRAQLMLALYRSGRQAEALEVYRDARRALVEELGLEPGRSLRELQQSILAQDLTLDLEPRPDVAREPAPVPQPLPAVREPSARGERKTVSVVHARVSVTSTDGAAIDPEILRRLLARAFDEIAQAIEAHEGTIEAITGDSISGVFGLPVVHEDDPARAARAAEDARARLAVLEPDSATSLELRIGVSTGEVMTGGAADGQFRAAGEPLTRAAQLSLDAGPEEVLLDDATRRAVVARRDGSRFSSPMVGRARETRRLHDAFDQAAGDGSCQLFTILGAAGVGKSRLVQEFLGDVVDRALVARGRCLPYGEGITFWPVLEAIKDVAGFEDVTSPNEVRSQLAALLADAPEAADLPQRLTEVMGVTGTTAAVDEAFVVVTTFFEALAARVPLVVVFDDVHWGEETFLDLVEHVADWSRGAPILLLCMARPELLEARPSWGGGKLNATSVLLEALSDDECMELVTNLVGEASLAEEVKGRISDAAEGNPLFVEEVLSMLIDDGLLVRHDGHWAAAGDLTGFPVPPTIQALLSARLDQLSPDERAVIEPAAVEGKVFHESSVVRLAHGAPFAPTALAMLVRKELIRPDRAIFAGERAFRFRHLMIRDAAYDAIPKEARAVLHERHVGWLEERTRERSVEFDEIIGYHLEQAFCYRTELGGIDDESRALGRRAAEKLGSAGRRAFVRSDAPAGVNLISRAVGLLAPDDPLRVELVPNVRAVQGMTDLSWADRVLTEAVEAAATTGDRRLASHALVQRGLLRLFTEPEVTPRELIDVSERAIEVFDELQDELGLARARRLIAQAHYLDKQIASCAEASERALTHARLAEDLFEEREILEWLVIAQLLGPAPAGAAIARLERLLDETARNSALQAPILAGLANLVAMEGRTEDAIEFMEQSRKRMVEAGEWNWIVAFWWGDIWVWQGEPTTAESELRPGYEALKKIGEKSHFSSVCHALSEVVYAQGRFEEAERLTRECEEACRANDVHSQIRWRAIRAKVIARRRDFEEAERLAREALALAETSDFLPAHAETLADLGEVLELAGRRDDAAEVLERALELHELKGNGRASHAVRTRLAAMS